MHICIIEDEDASATRYCANGRASRAQSQACLSYAETKPALALANTLRDPSEMDVAVCGGKKGGRKEGRKIFRPHSHPKPKENHKKRDALLGSTSFHVLSLITMSSEIIRRVSRLSSLFYCYCRNDLRSSSNKICCQRIIPLGGGIFAVLLYLDDFIRYFNYNPNTGSVTQNNDFRTV